MNHCPQCSARTLYETETFSQCLKCGYFQKWEAPPKDDARIERMRDAAASDGPHVTGKR